MSVSNFWRQIFYLFIFCQHLNVMGLQPIKYGEKNVTKDRMKKEANEMVATSEATSDLPTAQMEAVVGEPVYLPCDITSTSENDAVLLVLWYREDLGTPIYSIDARERDFSIAERWSDENVFSNRAYFIQDKTPAELGIDHIRESDSGVYRCRVDFRIARTRNSKVNLTVIVPPQKVVITDDSGLERTSVVGPFSEGASFVLRCDVFGGKPIPTVTWFRNDVPIKTTSTLIPTGPASPRGGMSRVRTEISVRHLTRADVHSELTCRASNNNKTSPLAATIHVDMNFGPLDVRILGANQPLSANRRYDLLCQSSGSRPPASITWWKNGQRLESNKETTSSDGNTTISTLLFTASKEDAGKYLSCRAENPVINSESLEDGWRLEIQYVPETKIILGTSLNPDNIREKSDVYFDCLVKAHPPVYKVEWRHNGRVLNHNIPQGIIISNQSLVLQSVSRSTAGNYTCVGFNTEGDGESNVFFLNVMFAPTCKPNQPRIHGVAKQEKAEIQCHVDANPRDVHFRWTFNNSAESIDVAAAHVTQVGDTSVVSYTPMTELDYGTLLCWASNKIGNQRVPCVFHIIAAGRPDQVHNCTTTYISMTSFTVRCSEGFNGGLPQSFLLEVRDTHTQQLRVNVTSASASFNVTGLEPGAQYQTAVYAYNPKGKAEPIIIQASTLRLPEKQLTSERDRNRAIRFTPMMSVSIGVISALVIVSLVVIVVMRFQCAGSNHKRHKGRTGADDHRGSITASSDKGSGSPMSKHESSGGEGDSDEKNPDIIPQPMDADEQTDFLRKRQHISTIETSSPSRLMQANPNPGGGTYMGYCTLRNGIPMNELVNQQMNMHRPLVQTLPYSTAGTCTLPRQHWAAYSQMNHLQISPPNLYQLPPAGVCTSRMQPASSTTSLSRTMAASHGLAHNTYNQTVPMASVGTATSTMTRLPLQSIARHERPHDKDNREPAIPLQALSSEDETSVDTPLMLSKRESSV